MNNQNTSEFINIENNDLTVKQKSEIDVHLSEYKALSEFQRDAKTAFVKVAMYHNTGIIVATTWFFQNVSTPNGWVKAVIEKGYIFPIVVAIPVVNSILIVACAYHVYSFFCVALHFQYLRNRLVSLLGSDVLAYEDKFGKSHGHQKELSIILDTVAAVMWFLIPVILAFVILIMAPICFRTMCNNVFWISYSIGTFFSIVAIAYLVGVVILLIKTRNKSTKIDTSKKIII
jgi:hypothetical protein